MDWRYIKNEKWYNAKYNNTFFPIDLGREFDYTLKLEIPKLNLPEKNIFIPKNLALVKSNEIDIYPIKLSNEQFDTWYKIDNKFNIPKIYCNLILYIDKILKNAKNFLITQIYFDLVNNKLSTILYNAGLCSTGYQVNMQNNYVQIIFYGYSDVFEKIVKVVIDNIINLTIKEKEFDFIKYNYHDVLVKFNDKTIVKILPHILLIHEIRLEKIQLKLQ